MRTPADAETILYQLIQGSALDTACNGVIRKGQRPYDSDKEDIIINSPTGTIGQTQRMVANVNIYVKDIIVPGDSHDTIKDSARIKVLSDLAVALLEEHYDVDYNFFSTNLWVMAEPDRKQHFINIRMDFVSHPF